MSEKIGQNNTFIQDLGDAARQNPFSAALIGMGVLWLFSRGGTAGRVGDLLNRGIDRAPGLGRETLDSVRSGAASVANAAADTARSSLDAVREGGAASVDQIADYARDMPMEAFSNARDNLSELFRAQPLALGAIGLAIGAGIAAALPKTEMEDTYLGEVSDELKHKAANLAGEQLDNAVTLASDVVVVAAASAEARNQGLTIDGARDGLTDVKGRVGRVAEAAKQATFEAVR
jgi:hypothetical protein